MLYIICILLLIIAIGVLLQSSEGKNFLKKAILVIEKIFIFLLSIGAEFVLFYFLIKGAKSIPSNENTVSMSHISILLPSLLLLALNYFYIMKINEFLKRKYKWTEKTRSILIAIFVIIFLGIISSCVGYFLGYN